MFDRILTTGTGDSNNYKITNYEVGKVKSVEWPWHGKVVKESIDNGGVITYPSTVKMELPSGKNLVLDPLVGTTSYYSLIRFKDPTSVSTLSPNNPDWQIWDDCLYRPDSIFLYGKDQAVGIQNFLFHDGTYNLVVNFLDGMGYNNLSYRVKIGFITAKGFQPLHDDITFTIPTFSGGKEYQPPLVLDATLDGSKILLKLFIQYPNDYNYEENWTGNWFGTLQVNGTWPNYTFSFTKDGDEYFDRETTGEDPYEVVRDLNGATTYPKSPFPNGDFIGAEGSIQQIYPLLIMGEADWQNNVIHSGVPDDPPVVLDQYTTEQYQEDNIITNNYYMPDIPSNKFFDYSYNHTTAIKQRVSGFFSGNSIKYLIKSDKLEYSLSNSWNASFAKNYESTIAHTTNGTITWHQGGPGGQGPCGIIGTSDYGCWWILSSDYETTYYPVPDPFIVNNNSKVNYKFLSSSNYYCDNNTIFEFSRSLDILAETNVIFSDVNKDREPQSPVISSSMISEIKTKIGNYEYHHIETNLDGDYPLFSYHLDKYGRIKEETFNFIYANLNPENVYIINDDTIKQTTAPIMNLFGNSVIGFNYNIATITGVNTYPVSILLGENHIYPEITEAKYLGNYSYNGVVIAREDLVTSFPISTYACYNPKTQEFIFNKDPIWWI